jgi:DMSO reductase anchor subunit
MPSPTPVELIPARPQTLWGVPAVVNFVLGGTGAGLYVAAAAAAGFRSSVTVTTASWLGPALVLAGFLAVATEAGRPLRGLRVLARVATSWMSRELWIGGIFIALAAGEFVVPGSAQRFFAAAAAVMLVLAQGLILRRAEGIAAWSVPPLPLVFIQSALVAGAGLLVLIKAGAGTPPGRVVLDVGLALLLFAALVWLKFVTWSGGAFAEATRCLREGTPALVIFGGGYVAPFVLFTLTLALGDGALALPVLAGLLMVTTQAYAKAFLILKCGQLRPITIPHLRFSPKREPQADQNEPQTDQKGPDARRRRATTEAYSEYAAGRSKEPTTQMALFHRPRRRRS